MRKLVLVIALTVALRLGAAVYLGDNAAPLSGAHDQISYDTLALRLLDGHGYSFAQDWYPFTKANEPTSHWSFAYTLYLTAVYAVTGHHPLAARLIQALLSGGIAWLLYRLGTTLFDRRTGLAAAAAFALYAYWIFFNAALMTQTFYVMCLLSALLAVLQLRERPSMRGWVWLGLSLGLGALFRQTLILFAPVLVLWLAWDGRARIPRTAWLTRDLVRGAAVAAVIVALMILPWTVRNYLAYDDFLLLNSNGGYWFYASNHPIHGTNFDPSAAPPIPAALVGLSEPAIDRALFREGLNEIAADPGRFVLLSLNRTKDYFWLVPSDQSSPISNAARLFSFALYLPFMLLGLWLSRKNWRACLPLYLYIGFDTVLHLATWAAPRYRLPSDALLMVFVGLSLRRFIRL
ncbi:MAG: glycosyltransferase family 39 protein [Chloroflexi bacterium]|nr:glycosyltransferase family 39 protein [Chloroflexota bacterium]